MHQILEAIEADVHSRPLAMEFEMAYQARVAIDRIKFAIKHSEQFASPCEPTREVGIQLLDALESLETVDRRFQIRSRMAASHQSGRVTEVRGRTKMLLNLEVVRHSLIWRPIVLAELRIIV
jgi:hypothetical protein